MGEKPKNPAQKLSSTDKDVLEKVVFLYAANLYSLSKQYPNPKKYVENVLLRTAQSDIAIAALNTIIYAKNNPTDYSFKPGELNRRLANDLVNTIQQNYYDSSVQQPESDRDHMRFMHPRELREMFKFLEEHGILLHLKGKKEIVKYKRKSLRLNRPGKKSPVVNSENNRGGRPSLYITTEEFVKLKKAMNKSDALDFLHDKIIKSGLALELARYLFLLILHGMKADENVVQKRLGIGASFFQSKMTEKIVNDLGILHQKLRKVDDRQLEQIANDRAKSAVESRGYYSLLFLMGFLKL
jgi:hypothetical protein